MIYKIGVIGTGFGAKVQVPAFKADSRFEVKSIAGRNAEKTQSIATEFGIEGTPNWEDLLEQDLDMIVVSTPPYYHFEMARKVLESGKHILLEKPTTSNAYEAKQLLRLAEKNRLVGILSHEFRWVPERMYMRDLIAEGKIGTVREIYFNQYTNFGFSTTIDQFGWFWDSLYEGGLLGGLGSHLFDWIRSSTSSEFETVSGRLLKTVPYKTSEDGKRHRVSADSGFHAQFTMEDSITGNISLSTTVSNPIGSQVIFAGDKGTLSLADSLQFGAPGEGWVGLEIPESYQLDNSLIETDRRIPPYMKLLDVVAESLDAGISMSPNLYDGWKNQQVVDAVKLSDSTGSRIKIMD